MSELSHKDIDNLFQQGVEQHDFEYKEEAWSRMDLLLQKDRRRRRAVWWLSGIGALGLLLLLAWLLPLTPSAENTIEERFGKTEDPLESRQAPVAPMPSPPLSQSVDKEASLQESKASDNPSANLSPSKTPTATNTAGESAVQTETPVRGLSETTPLPENSPITQSEATSSGLQAVLDSRDDMATTGLKPLPFVHSTPTMELPPRPLPDSVLSDWPILLPDQVTPHKAGHLYLGINISAEAATVGTEGFDKIALKPGLTLEYRFREHWGIGIGAYYSRKDYYARGDQYDTGDDYFWTYGVVPDKADGYCKMVEIPLFASYHFKHFEGSHFYLEAGLTSYLMLEENYWFYYEDPPPHAIEYWGSDGGNNSWMSILQFSPGYQWQVANRFGLQIAPYLELPMNGVGYGNLDMISAGINLRLLMR